MGRLKHISILIPEGDCSITHIEATHQIFSSLNDLLNRLERPELFQVQLVGLHREAQVKKGLFRVYPDIVIDDLKHTDLVIIPAIQESVERGIEMNKVLGEWILKQYKNGAEIASFCIGSFLLASTGLLNGRKCTTHWSAASQFKALFPEIELLPDKIITDEGGIYTSGGALSFQNLIIYLVEKYAGRDTAILAAKTFMIDIDRNSQSPFMIFNAQKEHDDGPIGKVQEFIETNLQEKLSVDQLAGMVAISRRNFERRFKKATSNSILEYIQRVRIEAAKKSLETSGLHVNEVMFNVGYTDIKAFRNTFKKITGLSPIDYRNKYNRRAVRMN
ncbi:GlxA family transcriptional regulator [Desertivirga arenae]|uniref:GlxA family transcriptional regulator n=1 Tax=Desertivirga arenae TaxID=2810309 RepID=UPI001A961F01|nr:helix-turn-helix domain-containing protein [Pedobacter sp. SYSU D00823]